MVCDHLLYPYSAESDELTSDSDVGAYKFDPRTEKNKIFIMAA